VPWLWPDCYYRRIFAKYGRLGKLGIWISVWKIRGVQTLYGRIRDRTLCDAMRYDKRAYDLTDTNMHSASGTGKCREPRRTYGYLNARDILACIGNIGGSLLKQLEQ
jgi:hypothetical protein